MKTRLNVLNSLGQGRDLLGLAGACLCFLLTSVTVSAQQTNGTPGSPSATTTIPPGNQLPAPDPKFDGVIKDNALQSKPWWAPRIVPPKQAPNVLLIMTDDSEFGVPSTYGDVIPARAKSTPAPPPRLSLRFSSGAAAQTDGEN
jgi:hypothetical protein